MATTKVPILKNGDDKIHHNTSTKPVMSLSAGHSSTVAECSKAQYVLGISHQWGRYWLVNGSVWKVELGVNYLDWNSSDKVTGITGIYNNGRHWKSGTSCIGNDWI